MIKIANAILKIETEGNDVYFSNDKGAIPTSSDRKTQQVVGIDRRELSLIVFRPFQKVNKTVILFPFIDSDIDIVILPIV